MATWFQRRPVVRIVGVDYSPFVLHGTTRSSARAFLKGEDVPKHHRQRTISEWGEDIIYVSEPHAPQAALMFGEHGGKGFGGRVLLELEIVPGARILDLSHEIVRRGSMGTDAPFEVCTRPAITDDMKEWLNESRALRGVPPLTKERLGAVDPMSERFSPSEYLPMLNRYALDRGYDGVRVADETIIVNRDIILGGRTVSKRERDALHQRRPGTGSLFSERCEVEPPETFGQLPLFTKPELYLRRKRRR